MATDTDTTATTGPAADRDDTYSRRVVDAVADAAGVDPLALEPPLYRVVDPDALDRLFRSGTSGRVRFEYAGHAVVVHADGTVAVDGTVHAP